ncbi:MAG: GNAT family N-acetyltransferase [Candidatus Limnocylindria bacterium]
MDLRTQMVDAAVAVRTATPADFPRVADSMASAFFDNPITIWHVPDESRRLDVMRGFFAVLLENVYTRFGLVFTNAGEVASGAMWIAHDVQEDGRPKPGLPLLECRTCNTPRARSRVPRNMVVPPDASAEVDRALAVVFRDFPRTFELFELFDAHHPQEPHYYLQFIGVRHECQGTGIGSALLQAVLDRCDLEGAAAYLEADERSKLLYLSHGFEAAAELRLPEGPRVWPMWRAPRRVPDGEEAGR